MRVQFTVTNTEWSKLQALAQNAMYPDVPSYCKDTVLKNRTYGKLWQTIVDKIAKMKKGTRFALRDLVDTPPSNLGVKLFNHQAALGIRIVKKDNLSNIFEKL